MRKSWTYVQRRKPLSELLPTKVQLPKLPKPSAFSASKGLCNLHHRWPKSNFDETRSRHSLPSLSLSLSSRRRFPSTANRSLAFASNAASQSLSRLCHMDNKFGGAGDMFGDCLYVDCANLYKLTQSIYRHNIYQTHTQNVEVYI